MTGRTSSIVVIAFVLGLVVGYVIGTGGGTTSTPTAAPSPTASTAPTTARVGGLPVVALDALPPEAAEVVGTIEAGGPFGFDQDGATFENREGLLPDRPRGYYPEYTVATPGSDDRGPRRIVTGREGEMYWTADHYDSFAWIAR